jgi:hypothetical protein
VGLAHAAIVDPSFAVVFGGSDDALRAEDRRLDHDIAAREVDARDRWRQDRDEVIVRALFTGLCGTDLHIADGSHPRAVLPLAIFFVVADAGVGWLLTKAYFAVVWLWFLGSSGAAG